LLVQLVQLVPLDRLPLRVNNLPRSLREQLTRGRLGPWARVLVVVCPASSSLYVTDPHGVSLLTHELQTRRILEKVAASNTMSQRSLSRELGIALGLTNLLIRRLIAKGWIRIIRVRPNHVRYVVTPSGFAQQARLSKDYFLHSVRFYAEARDRVQKKFAEMVAQSSPIGRPAVVFYGAGEVAEVAYVCAQRTSLRLVGVVDDNQAGKDFFGLTVVPRAALARGRCGGMPYDWVVVTAADADATLRSTLKATGVPASNVFWL